MWRFQLFWVANKHYCSYIKLIRSFFRLRRPSRSHSDSVSGLVLQSLQLFLQNKRLGSNGLSWTQMNFKKDRQTHFRSQKIMFRNQTCPSKQIGCVVHVTTYGPQWVNIYNPDLILYLEGQVSQYLTLWCVHLAFFTVGTCSQPIQAVSQMCDLNVNKTYFSAQIITNSTKQSLSWDTNSEHR